MKLPASLINGQVAYFKLFTFRFPGEKIYSVIEKGNPRHAGNPLVRVQSACSFAHVFDSQRCDDRAQLDEAMAKIAESDNGLIIYAWPHEGRGVGMFDHTRVYMQQDRGEDTVTSYATLGLPIDARDFGDVVTILKDYKVKRMKLLTNSPSKINIFKKAKIQVTRVPLIAKLSKFNKAQLKAKIKKLGHFLDLKKASEKNSVLFYEGRRGLRFALQEMLEELTPRKIYRVFASGNMPKVLGSYYRIFQKEKSVRKIESLILYSEEMKKHKRILSATRGIKKFYSFHPFSSDIFIFNDKVLMISWTSNPPFGSLVVNKALAESYRKIFDSIWRSVNIPKSKDSK